MPSEFLAPGPYVAETPSRVRTISAVPTSITAFVGRTKSGPMDAPSHVRSFSDFERLYGGLASDCPLSYAVRHFFDNGGTEAVIARVVHYGGDDTPNEHEAVIDTDISDPSLAASNRGLWLLNSVDHLNLLCIPPLSPYTDVGRTTWDVAITWARSRRAFVIVDSPAAWTSAAAATTEVEQLVTRGPDAALYFPRVLIPDPLDSNNPHAFAPCGVIAGLYARTDAERGVWKAPAGVAAPLRGVTGLTATVADTDNGELNRLAVNTLRSFPLHGHVAWGARTLAGADRLNSEWKYVSVRRLALYIEECLYRGTQWAVFEPNGEPLWAELRLNVGTFLHNLFRQGAFQGSTPREAYFVKCDVETSTQTDIDHGFVNILIGFAPLKPAEFVVIKLVVRTASTSS